MISRFLKISTFSAQLLFRKCYYFRISNYSKSTFSKHTVLLNSYFFGKNLFRSRYLLRTVPFSEKLVLRNQLHCIYTWKDFPSILGVGLTLKFFNSLSLKIEDNVWISMQDVLQIWFVRKLVVIVVSSNTFLVQKML